MALAATARAAGDSHLQLRREDSIPEPVLGGPGKTKGVLVAVFTGLGPRAGLDIVEARASRPVGVNTQIIEYFGNCSSGIPKRPILCPDVIFTRGLPYLRATAATRSR